MHQTYLENKKNYKSLLQIKITNSDDLTQKTENYDAIQELRLLHPESITDNTNLDQNKKIIKTEPNDYVFNNIINTYNIPQNANLKNTYILQHFYKFCTSLRNFNNYGKSWFFHEISNRSISFYPELWTSYKTTGFLELGRTTILLSNNNIEIPIDDILDTVADDLPHEIKEKMGNLNAHTKTGMTKRIKSFNEFVRYVVYYVINSIYKLNMNNMLPKPIDDNYILSIVSDYANECGVHPDDKNQAIELFKNNFNDLSIFYPENNVELYKLFDNARVTGVYNALSVKVPPYTVYNNIIMNSCILDMPKYDGDLRVYRVADRYEPDLAKQIINELLINGYTPVRHILSTGLSPMVDDKLENNDNIFFEIHIPKNFPIFFFGSLFGKRSLTSEATEVLIPYCNNTKCDELSYQLTMIEYKNNYSYTIDLGNVLQTNNIKHYFIVKLELLKEPIKLQYFDILVDGYQFKEITKNSINYKNRYSNTQEPMKSYIEGIIRIYDEHPELKSQFNNIYKKFKDDDLII